jgi:signal transduction histidine kinase
MKKPRLKQFNRKHLKLLLTLFFLAVFLPTSFLVYQTYDQIKWEAYHQQRQLAEELAIRIDNQFIRLMVEEEDRAFANYSFLNVAGEPSASFLQRSPISKLVEDFDLPGLIGYFQVDHQGRFTTPLLPAKDNNFSAYGISKSEYAQRQLQQQQIFSILSENELIRPERTARSSPATPASEPVTRAASVEDREVESDARMNAPAEEGLAVTDAVTEQPLAAGMEQPQPEQNVSQSAFDELTRKQNTKRQAEESKQAYSLGKVEDLKLEQEYAETARAKKEQAKRGRLNEETQKTQPRKTKRKETTALPEQKAQPAILGRDEQQSAKQPARIEIFESEIDPFEFSLLGSGQFVLYRKAWRNEHRYIQGILLDSRKFLQNTINPVYRDATLAQNSDLAVAYNGDILTVISGFAGRRGSRYLSSTEDVGKELLYRTRLSPPFSDVELIFSAHNLPVGPGGIIISWTALVLFIILVTVFILIYRLGARQISLAQQQQDFVSAVSHELKTPLTSIRMYGEMLKEGWASEDKKKSYYDFIYHESERLSRLIQNILQLARMTRNELDIELSPISIAELIDTIRSKVTSQVERSGFTLNLDCNTAILDKKLLVETDYFSQIIINLVDNAIKFSTDSEKKQIDMTCSLNSNDLFSLHIRDYGPGIEKNQLKKIFTLFYRTENELTRKTVGTGIGLALVHQLTTALHGEIDVINRNPGAEFIISFPVID